MQGDCHVGVFLDDVVVVGAVIVGPIYPRHYTRMNPARVFNLRRLAHIGDECRLHHVFQLTYDNDAPRRMVAGFSCDGGIGHYAEQFSVVI